MSHRDMNLTTLRYEQSPRGIAVVSLNRPDKLNAFDQRMLDELCELIARLDAEPSIRVVVLRAEGRHFSSGADLSKPVDGASEVKHTGFIDLFIALERMTKPTIAVVQGACVGGAVALAASCDLVLAHDTAHFSLPQIRSGVAPVGVAPVLVRAMGIRNYRRMALSGTRIPAADAHRLGLVDAVHPTTGIDEATAAAAEDFLLGGPSAQAELKRHLASAYPDLLRDLEIAREHHTRIDTFKTPEAEEGVAAFLEGRKPRWYPPR